jgi:hypothetical protein
MRAQKGLWEMVQADEGRVHLRKKPSRFRDRERWWKTTSTPTQRVVIPNMSLQLAIQPTENRLTVRHRTTSRGLVYEIILQISSVGNMHWVVILVRQQLRNQGVPGRRLRRKHKYIGNSNGREHSHRMRDADRLFTEKRCSSAKVEALKPCALWFELRPRVTLLYHSLLIAIRFIHISSAMLLSATFSSHHFSNPTECSVCTIGTVEAR